MTPTEILVGAIVAMVLGVVLWWIIFRGGADWLDGTWLGMLFVGGIPKSSRGWNADSFKLYALFALIAALLYFIVKAVL